MTREGQIITNTAYIRTSIINHSGRIRYEPFSNPSWTNVHIDNHIPHVNSTDEASAYPNLLIYLLSQHTPLLEAGF